MKIFLNYCGIAIEKEEIIKIPPLVNNLIEENKIEEIFNSNCPVTRLYGYAKLGFNKKVFDDEDYRVRRQGYLELGWISKAVNDSNYEIRKMAYKELGFTKRAMEEEDVNVVNLALAYFGKCSEVIGVKKDKV